MIEESKNDKNFKLKELNIPIDKEIHVTFIVKGDINASLDIIFKPSFKVLGKCEEAMYCFIRK